MKSMYKLSNKMYTKEEFTEKVKEWLKQENHVPQGNWNITDVPEEGSVWIEASLRVTVATNEEVNTEPLTTCARTSCDENSIRNAVIALYKNLMQQQEELLEQQCDQYM